MIYTPEEKARMDYLLQVFQPYIDTKEFYDILYSEKAGFLRVCVGESADHIYFSVNSYNDMLHMFVTDFLQDEEQRVGHYLRRDYDHVRTLLHPYLEKLGDDREFAYDFLEQQIEICQCRCEQFRLERLEMIRETEELLEELRESVKA